jgi:hypothetical protein
MEYNEDGTEKQGKEMDHVEGTGTEQAGTSPESSIDGSKKEIAKDLAKEQEEIKKDEEEEGEGEEEIKEQDEVEKDEAEKDEAEEEVEESLENAVIEKLIAEMEEEDEDEDEKEEVAEGEKVKDEEFEGVAPGMTAPKEKKATGPEQDSQGAGTEQAGTGSANGQVPDRKDIADKFVKPKNYNEQEEPDEGEEEEEELDIDKEVKEGKVTEVAGKGPGPIPAMAAKAKNDNKEGDEADAFEEAFELFKEAIEEGD